MTKKFTTNLPRISDAKKPEPLITKRKKKNPYPFRLTDQEQAVLNMKTEEMNRISEGSTPISKTGTIRALIRMAAKTDAKVLLKYYVSIYTGV